jgi:hypothetical protein
MSFQIWSLRNPVVLATGCDKTQIVLGPKDKKRPRYSNLAGSSPVDIPPVHDLDGSRFENEFVQPIYVVDFGVGNVDADRKWASQIQLRVQLDSALLASHLNTLPYPEVHSAKLIEQMACKSTAVELQSA